MSDTTIKTPTVHLNGTSAESLLEMNRSAMEAVQKAYEAVQRAAPHRRDFYVQSPDPWATAHEEHVQRLRDLDLVKTELEAICLAVIRQKEGAPFLG